MEYKQMVPLLRSAVEEHSQEIITLGNDLWRCPETGFREHKTQARLMEELQKMGLSATTWPGTTGFNVMLDTGKPGPTVMILGELDSVVCYEHPDCDPETGAVHACGHHIQITSTIGAGYALLKSGVLGELCGKIILQGVPAEECLQLEWRYNERVEGRLRYMGGKAELLARGAYDGVDVIISMHSSNNPEKSVEISDGSNGFLAKSLTIRGRSAHAAGSPHEGINALYAASIGLDAFNAIRETFKDNDHVRVHPIMTKGGDIVNAIPEEVKIEALVRAATMDAVLDANKKYERAFTGAAIAMGAKVEFSTQPGYLPYIPYEPLHEVARDVAIELIGDPQKVTAISHMTGSTDIGDLSAVIPTVQPYLGLCTGGFHTKDYRMISDEVYTFASEYLAMLAAKLLSDGGKLARELKDNFKPFFPSTQAYCDYVDALFEEKTMP